MPEPARLEQDWRTLTSSVGLPDPGGGFFPHLDWMVEQVCSKLLTTEADLRSLQTGYKIAKGGHGSLENVQRDDLLLSLTVLLDVVRACYERAIGSTDVPRLCNYSGSGDVNAKLMGLEADVIAANARLRAKREGHLSTQQTVRTTPIADTHGSSSLLSANWSPSLPSRET